MAAPTNPCYVKILLANSEPSTHGTEGTFHLRLPMSAHWARPDVPRTCPLSPSLTHLRHPATNKNPGLGFGNAHLVDCSFPGGNGLGEVVFSIASGITSLVL